MSDTPAIAGFRVVSQDAWEAALAACEEYRSKLDKLERENAELRDDRELLDWLCTADGSAWVYRYLYKREKLTMDAIRAVRDEARQ